MLVVVSGPHGGANHDRNIQFFCERFSTLSALWKHSVSVVAGGETRCWSLGVPGHWPFLRPGVLPDLDMEMVEVEHRLSCSLHRWLLRQCSLSLSLSVHFCCYLSSFIYCFFSSLNHITVLIKHCHTCTHSLAQRHSCALSSSADRERSIWGHYTCTLHCMRPSCLLRWCWIISRNSTRWRLIRCICDKNVFTCFNWRNQQGIDLFTSENKYKKYYNLKKICQKLENKRTN